MQVYNDNTNVAYDLSLFDTETAAPVEQPKKAPVLKTKRTSASKLGKPVTVAMVCGLFLAALIMFLFSKAQLSEVSLKLSNEQAALDAAKSVNSILQSELSGSVTIENVEKYAEEVLKMQKINKNQEHFVEMNTGTLTQAAAEDNDNIFVAISRWFGGILEYFGF